MRSKVWLATVVLALALAACERHAEDPTSVAREVCADVGAEAEARIEACRTLIDSGALTVEERVRAFSNRGTAQYEAGDVTAALRDFNAALEMDGEAGGAMLGRAKILVESGQLDAAQPLVERLVASGRHLAEAHYLAGAIAQQRSDLDAAIEAYDASIAADVRFAPAYERRGSIKQGARDFAGAIEDYDAALRINGQLPRALAGRCWARVLMEGGDLEHARRDADAAATADPHNVPGQLCRGLLQLRSGEWAAARVSYEAALEVEPGNPTALFGRGVARRRSGDSDGREDMNRARDFDSHVGRQFEELGVRTY